VLKLPFGPIEVLEILHSVLHASIFLNKTLAIPWLYLFPDFNKEAKL
jgi:hypothetical protein